MQKEVRTIPRLLRSTKASIPPELSLLSKIDMTHNEKRSAAIKAKIAEMMKGSTGPKKPKIVGRKLTKAEQKEKTKNWPKGTYKAPSEKEKVAYQSKIGRAYND